MTARSPQGIASRRLRTALTVLAIVLGVAMVSAASLTDTMRSGADSLSESSYDGTDAVVSAKTAFKVGNDDFGARPTIPGEALEQVRAVAGVGAAVGDITDEVKLVGKDGKVIGNGPYFGAGVDPAAPAAHPVPAAAGPVRAATGEVVVDAGTAKQEATQSATRSRAGRGPVRTPRITGIATFGDVDSIGTATSAVRPRHRPDPVRQAGPLRRRAGRRRPRVRAAAAAHAARELHGADRRRPGPLRARRPGAGRRLHPGVPAGVRRRRGLRRRVHDPQHACRSRWPSARASWRCCGPWAPPAARSCARWWPRRSAMGASARSWASRPGCLAKRSRACSPRSAWSCPRPARVRPPPVIVSLLVGLGVTVLAALGPALRATRVSPVTAMREGADLRPSRFGRHSVPIAAGWALWRSALLRHRAFAPGIDAGAAAAMLGPACCCCSWAWRWSRRGWRRRWRRSSGARPRASVARPARWRGATPCATRAAPRLPPRR